MMKDMLNPLSNSFIFFKQRLADLEHPAQITEWNQNIDTAAYLEQLKKNMFHQGRKKSIVYLTCITGHKVLNMSYCGFSFKTF